MTKVWALDQLLFGALLLRHLQSCKLLETEMFIIPKTKYIEYDDDDDDDGDDDITKLMRLPIPSTCTSCPPTLHKSYQQTSTSFELFGVDIILHLPWTRDRWKRFRRWKHFRLRRFCREAFLGMKNLREGFCTLWRFWTLSSVFSCEMGVRKRLVHMAT